MGDIGFIAGICAEAAVALILIIIIIAIAKKSKKKKQAKEEAKPSEQAAVKTETKLLDLPPVSELPQAEDVTASEAEVESLPPDCSPESLCEEEKKDDIDTVISDVTAEISFAEGADIEEAYKISDIETIKNDDVGDSVEVIYAETVASGEFGFRKKAERAAIDTVVIAKNKFDNIIEAYEAMSREQKSFYDNLKKYALSKEGTTESLSRHYECVKMGKRIILKLQIKRGITCASFMLENSLLKSYRKSAAKAEGADIKIKETQVNVSDLAGFETAKDMIDLMIENIKREKAEKKNKSKPAE